MNLNPLILSVKLLITLITLNGCSLQTEFVESHRNLDLANQEIIEKQNIIKKLKIYILSQNKVLSHTNNTQSISVADKAVTKEQAQINIENAETSLKKFKIQIDNLKLKQQLLRRSIKSDSSQISNLI
mgnify:FL=1